MMKLKTTFVYLVIALAVGMFTFGFNPNTASAGTDVNYSSDYGWDFGGDTYTDYPVYSQSYDYSDYYTDYPIYSQSYDYDYGYNSGDTYTDYPIYSQSYEYDYSYPSYNYQTPSYSYQSYSRPQQSTPYMYTPAPSYSYQYATPNTGSAGSTNVNNNSSNSTSNNTNTNVNNNPINIVINGGTPVSGTYNPPSYQYLDGSCSISPSNISVNQDVVFTANATGGNGSYTYSWTGSDGIYSSARTFTGRFATFGQKTATVVISSNGQSISRSCSVNVDTNYVNNNNLGVYCIANPTSSAINQNVVWTAYPTGGNGSYTYSWTGTDGLSYGNSQAIQRAYTTAGVKTATVTVYSNGQSMSATCNATVTGGSNVTVIREPGAGTPVSGVFLSEVPATGISAGWKVSLFAIGLILWSAYLGYVLVSRKNKTLAVATADKMHAFKLANMQKKGLIK